jgi:hypothetical protein
MELLLDKTNCPKDEAVSCIVSCIRDAVYHMTGIHGYGKIITEGVLRPNDGTLPSSFETSEACNCRQLNGVSLWDFERPDDSIVYDSDSLWKCETVLLRYRPSIFLGFQREALDSKLLYYQQIKERCGYGGIIPYVEVCHVGEIQVELVTSIVVASFHDGDLMIRRKSGYLLTDEDLDLRTLT